MKNRDMFYQNTQTSYNNPGMYIPPSGYNINTDYMAYGPNVMPPNMINNNQNDEYETRISELEKHMKSLENRVQKLESKEISDNDNLYMI